MFSQVFVQGGLCPGGLCPGVGSLSRRGLSGRPPYGNVRAVGHYLSEFFHQYDEINKANKGKYLISAEFREAVEP